MMTPEDSRTLKTQLVLLASYYRQSLDNATLCMWAEDLADLTLVQVTEAMRSLRRDPRQRGLPMPADIRARANPKGCASLEAQAMEVAGKITEAMRRFGYTQTARAREHMGEVGWLVVTRLGGYRHKCQTMLSTESNTFMAQARDMAKSVLELESLPAPNDAPQLNEHNKGTRDAWITPGDVLLKLALQPR